MENKQILELADSLLLYDDKDQYNDKRQRKIYKLGKFAVKRSIIDSVQWDTIAKQPDRVTVNHLSILCKNFIVYKQSESMLFNHLS
jgi:hypothetical protein